MDIIITGIKYRAIDTKMCDFLGDSGALILTDGKTLDVLIEVKSNVAIEFISDEREYVSIKLVKAGKKIAYSLDCVDFDTITLQ